MEDIDPPPLGIDIRLILARVGLMTPSHDNIQQLPPRPSLI